MLDLTDLQAEQTILGHFLTQNAAMLDYAGRLQADHFVHPAHAAIFEAMSRESTAGRSFSVISIAAKLPAELDGLPQPKNQYLIGLQRPGWAPEISDAVETLIETTAKRNIRALCDEAMAGIEAGRESDELTARLISGLQDAAYGSDASVFRSEMDVAEKIVKDAHNPASCTPTGLPRFDAAMEGGFFPGCVYGLMGRFKSGKSAFAGTVSENLSQLGTKHVYFALEMGADAIHQRKLARRAKTTPRVFRDKPLMASENHVSRIADAIVSGGDSCIYADVPGVTLERLQRLCAAAVYRHKVKGIILDYWQLVTGKARNESEASHLAHVAQWMADFCKKHGVWALVLGQINQEGNTRGSEGSQLAFDMVFDLCRGDPDREDTRNEAWLETRVSRYTEATDIGSAGRPAYVIKGQGPYFEELSA